MKENPLQTCPTIEKGTMGTHHLQERRSGKSMLFLVEKRISKNTMHSSISSTLSVRVRCLILLMWQRSNKNTLID